MVKKPGKRLRWGIYIGIVVLLLAGAYAYFIGTQAVLRQAEAFAFRRMTVPQLAEQGTFQFFYATNRIAAESPTIVRLDHAGATSG